MGRFHILHAQAHAGQLGGGFLVVLQIAFDAAFSLFLRQKILVHIIPVFSVSGKEGLEIRLIFNFNAVNPQSRKHSLQLVQSVPGRVNAKLQPFHACSPSPVLSVRFRLRRSCFFSPCSSISRSRMISVRRRQVSPNA